MGRQVCSSAEPKQRKHRTPPALLGGGAPRPARGQLELQAAIRVHSSHHERVCTTFHLQCAPAWSTLAVSGQGN